MEAEEDQSNSAASLPPEVLLQILQWLGPRDLCTTALTCTSVYQLSLDERLKVIKYRHNH